MKVRRAVSVPKAFALAATALCAMGRPPSASVDPTASPSLWDNIRDADGIVLARIAPLPPPCLERGDNDTESEDDAIDIVTMDETEDATQGTTEDATESATPSAARPAAESPDADASEEAGAGDDEADEAAEDDALDEGPLVYHVPERMMVLLRFDVEEVWKGARVAHFETRVPTWEMYRRNCLPERTVVAFLSRENGAVVAWKCLYGDKDPAPGALESLRKQVRRAVSIQGKGAAGLNDRIDWLVDQVELTENFREALYELSPAGDRDLYAAEATIRRPLAPMLTNAQMDRIERSFLRRRVTDESLPGFLFILADRPSRAIDDAAIAAIDAGIATLQAPQGPAPPWLKDAIGLELERFGDGDGRIRALIPDWCPVAQLRKIWETARRELGIPKTRRGSPSVDPAGSTAPPREGG